jgi:membrane peptidoglycan carboxypeptidase
MLQEVVRVGTATAGQISGYDVAGKTGTARKPNTNGPGYQNGAYISTFAGFVPAGNPQLTAIVILDQPTPIYGGLVAAPVFADIARYALQEMDIPPVPQGPDREGVPFADPSASAAADESDAGTTAAEANAATANANKGQSTTSTTTPAATDPKSTTSTTTSVGNTALSPTGSQ